MRRVKLCLPRVPKVYHKVSQGVRGGTKGVPEGPHVYPRVPDVYLGPLGVPEGPKVTPGVPDGDQGVTEGPQGVSEARGSPRCASGSLS